MAWHGMEAMRSENDSDGFTAPCMMRYTDSRPQHVSIDIAIAIAHGHLV